MKKVLSIMLALCMLLTMVVIPAAAAEDVNAGKLYYKFDFSEDTLYTDYQNPVLPDGVSYESFAAANTIGTNVFEYGKIGDQDGLYIRSGGAAHNVVFTPLKEDGKPIVLEAGKQYVVEWEYVVTRGAGAWARPYIEPYTTLDGASSNTGDRYIAYYTTTEGEGEAAVETKNYLAWHDGTKKTMLGFASLYGSSEWQYWNAGTNFVSAASDDVVLEAYDKKTETVEGAEGEEPTTKVSYVLREDAQYDNGVSATGVKYTTTQTVNILSDAEMEETYGIVKNEDGSYSFNGTAYNNFLGLSLPGGYGGYYYPGKDEKSIENVQDEEGNWYHRAYSEYYVTGLRVYDAEYKFATVTCIVGDNETVVNTIPGEEINYPEIPASFNGTIKWSLSADEYVPVPTVAGTEDITVYAYSDGVASFENYGRGDKLYVTNEWLTNAMVSDEMAYSGDKSIKYHNYNLNVIKTEPADWATAWTKYYSYDAEADVFTKLAGEAAPAFEVGKYYQGRGANSVEQGAFIVADLGNSKDAEGAWKNYTYTKKVSFKYFVPAGNTKPFTVKAMQYNSGNIWWGTAAVSSEFSIPATPTGEWKTFEMLIKAEDLPAAGRSGSGYQYIALKIGTTTIDANGRDATIYVDDVTMEDVVIEDKVTYHYNDGVTEDEVITEGIEYGVPYAIDRVPTSAPEGKYFAGWYTDEACTVPAGSTVTGDVTGAVNLYAKFADYVSGGTYDYKNADVAAANGFGYMKDGVYYGALNETGWQTKQQKAEGTYIAKATGNANAFNPTNTSGTAQRTDTLINQGYSYLAATDAVGSTKYADMAVGEETVIGWGAFTNLIIKDASGKAFVPKPNAQYRVEVKLNVLDAGPANTAVALLAGRKLDLAQTGANDKSNTAYGAAVSETKTITEAGEQVITYNISTGDMANAVPVLSLHFGINGFKAKKVAEANGVASYTLDNGSTVYPFEIVSKVALYVEEVTVTELDSKVTLVNGDKETVIAGFAGDAIEYPALAANLNFDHVWSLSADEYIPVPTTFDGEVTVYAFKNPVLGLENYKGHAYDKGANISVSDEQAYGGEKSFRYEDIDYTAVTEAQALNPVGDSVAWLTSSNQFFWKNALVFDEETETFVPVSGDEAPEFEEGKYFRNRNNNKDHGLALWTIEKNKAYKVTYKYYVEKISADINVTAVVSANGNIWTPTAINAGTAVISKDSAVGEWLDGEIYLNNASNNYDLYMLFSNIAVASGDILYFDDFAIEEVQVVSFVIPEGFAAEIYDGELKDGVITAYYGEGEEIVAPLVVDLDGNIVELWVDADGKQVTEFVAGGVYTPYVESAFTYGDCNDDGNINTTDLAALKLKLAGTGEVGLGADCNGDGNVNTTDLAALKLFLAGTGDLGPQA